MKHPTESQPGALHLSHTAPQMPLCTDHCRRSLAGRVFKNDLLVEVAVYAYNPPGTRQIGARVARRHYLKSERSMALAIL